MNYMLVRNDVRDFDAWKQVFDSELGSVREAGMEFVNMWRSIDDPNTVFFLLSISDLDRAKAFVADPASAETGQRAGVLDGEIRYVVNVD